MTTSTCDSITPHFFQPAIFSRVTPGFTSFPQENVYDNWSSLLLDGCFSCYPTKRAKHWR